MALQRLFSAVSDYRKAFHPVDNQAAIVVFIDGGMP
jgi:hypothetical protein